MHNFGRAAPRDRNVVSSRRPHLSKQLRAESTDIALPAGQPKWRHEDRRIRPGFELEQYRAFFGPRRLWFIRAIRWLYRTLDRLQTVEKRRFFASLARLN